MAGVKASVPVGQYQQVDGMSALAVRGGKLYVEVPERVRIVNEKREWASLFQVVESGPYEFMGRALWKAVILIDNKQFTGTAEIHFDVPSNVPEGKNPFECAETSAIGRALGFANIGVLDSIASAEEVNNSNARPEPVPVPDLPTLKSALQELNITYDTALSEAFSAEIVQGKLKVEELKSRNILPEAYRKRIASYIEKRRKQAS
jgi:hypothetical protein